MTDPDTLRTVLRIGVAPALLAAVFLYLVTSRGERSGFHLFPSTPREWAHDWFRTMVFALLCGVFTLSSGGCVFYLIAAILFIFAASCPDLELGFRIAGIILSVLSVLAGIAFPVYS
jgi:hypothetical protein